MRRWRWTSRAALALSLPLLACGPRALPPRGAFVAVWVGAESEAPRRDQLEALAAAGARELFWEAGAVSWETGRPRLVAAPAPALPRETPVTLVVSGEWNALAESPRTTARAWEEGIAALEIRAREGRAVATGVHFELRPGGANEELAAVLDRLRTRLRRLYVSASLDREALARPESRALRTAVDYVVVDLYGQPLEAPEDGKRWELARTRAELERLDAAGVECAVGAWTLGTARRRMRTGEVVAQDGSLALSRLLGAPALRPRGGTIFEGVDRQVLELVAREPTEVGAWRLGRGESVRVTRPTTRDLESLLAAVAAARPDGAGVVLRRWPGSREALSLSPSNLVAALAPGFATPDLQVDVKTLSEAGRSLRVRVVLQNGNDEQTEFSSVDSNYVELGIPEGSLVAVDPGEFAGWEQYWRGSERRTVRALRSADTVRLFVPFVGGGERVESGVIELRRRAAGAPFALRAGGSFLLPGGREWKLAGRPTAKSGER